MKAKVNKNQRGLAALVIVAVAAVLLIGRIGYLQIIKGDYYSSKAESQQLSDNEIAASRGKIYDANMNVLAQSASVWKVYLNPSKINNFDEEERDQVRGIIASGLSAILGVEEETVLKYTQKNYSYQLVKSGIEKDTRDAILDFIDEYADRDENPIDLSNIVCIDPDVKRYYPYSSLASTVIGFTGSDGVGRAGLEYYYDDTLKGVAGRTITAVKGNGSEMPNQYETVYEAQEGNSIVLTIDIYIQHILEDVLSKALEDTGAENIYGIVMDVDTGAILGMVSLPDYDLNDPYLLKSEELADRYKEAASETEPESLDENEKYLRSKTYFQNLQWSNRAITNTYEPGSVFKVITAAAAVEEGVADLNTGYFCSGIINFATRDIHCWKSGGHGSQTLVDLLKNSCNPFAVTVASNLGKDVYYDYFEAFGLTEKTGVDTTGDFSPAKGVLYMSRNNFSKSDLASYSFGQTFQVSPLQMITAISAVANGGNLMTPYLVSKEIDAEGNTVRETEPVIRRQVISESTAEIISYCMEEVVATGTGKNAYVAGYHVAGKTGTSEKLVENKDGQAEEYIASFCGFAPADDPEISVIIIVDEPDGEHGGGAVAAPLAGEVFEQVLTHLGVERSYNREEMSLLVETAPLLTGKTIAQANSAIAGLELSIKVVGDGDKVVAQYPDAGREIPADGIIVVYTEQGHTSETVTVPDFTGCTVSQANKLAVNSGLNIKISGSSLNSGTVYAYKQSIEAGQSVNMGEIITVSFKTNVDVAD
ncbi:MAG: PASTA domain-containing protein [Clostridia bacterium]|nr:PASTA domain-containing protein [Clostridia bacterium]